MDVTQLSRDQLIEVKLSMLETVIGHHPSWGDLAEVDTLVSDQQVYEEFAGTCFIPDDFFC